jgi:hypothetical protein
MPITIGRDERHAVREALLNDLARIGDVELAIQKADYATARRLRQEIEEDFRLLDDVGWGEDDPAATVALTVPLDDLARTLRRLHGLALGAIRQYVVCQPEDHQQFAERNTVACTAFGRILGEIATRSPEQQPTREEHYR